MPTIIMDDWSLHYQGLGEGPDVVLLHGLSGDLAFWPPLVVLGLTPRYRLTLVDLRGHGRSGLPKTGYTTRDLAEDVRRLLDKLEIPAAHVVGHSFGGAVALHFAALHPDRVAGLVLADTRVRALQPAQGLRDWAPWAGVRERLVKQGLEMPDEELEFELSLMTTLARHRLAGKLEGLSLEPFFLPFATGTPRRAEAWLRMIDTTTAFADFKDTAGLTPEAIGRIDCRTLLLYGEMSHCLPSQEALQRLLPGAVSRRVPGAGHFHPIVKPQVFLDEMRAFLAGSAEGTGRATGQAAARD